MIGKTEEYYEIQRELEKITDTDKIKYLKYDLPDWVEYNIQVDNDDVYIHLGYDENEDSIGVHFDESGYYLLLTLFECLGLKSEFV